MCSAINIKIYIKLILSFQRKLSTKPHQENYKNLLIHMANQGVFKIKLMPDFKKGNKRDAKLDR